MNKQFNTAKMKSYVVTFLGNKAASPAPDERLTITVKAASARDAKGALRRDPTYRVCKILKVK